MRQIEHIREELQERKRELLETKRQNTKVINEITDLGERENELKKKLDSTGKQLFVRETIYRKTRMWRRRTNWRKNGRT